MAQEHVHRAASVDGTEIAGRVYGTGAPLVLVHGALADGEAEWEVLLPHLTDQFRCYVMSTRGRGESADHPDHSPERVVGDVAAFADSIGEPVALVGVSGGGRHALGAAARASAVTGVAVHEPVVMEILAGEMEAEFWGLADEMERLVSAGRATDAVKLFFGYAANETEQQGLADTDGTEVLDAAARYLPVDLAEWQAIRTSGWSPTAPSVLGAIGAPVLVLHGDRTALPDVPDSVSHVISHVPNAEAHEITGAGHLAHYTHAEVVASELKQFFGVA